MPIKKAAAKALRQTKKITLRRAKVTSDVEALIRKVRKAVVAKNHNQAADWLRQTLKKIDKATQNGIFKKNTAARKKSRLAAAVNALTKK